MNLLNFAADFVNSTPTTTTSASGHSSPAGLIIAVVLILIEVVGLWRVFQKAGKPGWGAIIPIYNLYLMVKIAGRPSWWVILYIIPIVNLVINVIVSMDIAKAFGKSTAFGILGLWLFGFVGYPMLGFGDATYQGDGNTGAPITPTAATI